MEEPSHEMLFESFFFLLLVLLLPLLSLFLYIFGMSREWSPAKQKICRRHFHVRDGASRGWGCGDKKRWQSRLEVAATHKDGFYAANSTGRSHIAGWRGAASEILPVSRSRTIWRGVREAFTETGSCRFLQQPSHIAHLDLVVKFWNIVKRQPVMSDPVVQVRVKRKSRGLISCPVASHCCFLVTFLGWYLWQTYYWRPFFMILFDFFYSEI